MKNNVNVGIDTVRGLQHRVDDNSLGAGLVDQLEEEAMGGGWWAIVPRSNGELHFRKDIFTTGLPEKEKRDYARRTCIALNKNLEHYKGVWITAWVDHNKKLVNLWKDEDGDHQVTLYEDSTWERLRKIPIDQHVGCGEVLIRKWVYKFIKEIQPNQDQQFLKAKGQPQPPSLR